MKIGVKLPNSGPFATVDNIRRTARACDQLRYDSLWVHDHIHRTAADVRAHFVAGSVKAWESHEGPITPDVIESVSTLVYVAGITNNMALGTSVLVLPLRNPVWLAKMYACLDHYCGGRAILGIGVGGGPYIEDELNAAGLGDLLSRRGRATDEHVEIIRGLWENDTVDFDGEITQIKGATVFPKPLQARLPIWYGGRDGPIAMTRVARSLDGWLPMFFSPDHLRESREKLLGRASDYGRDPSEITVASEHWMTIDESNEIAVARAVETREAIKQYTGQFHTPDSIGNDYNLTGSPDALLELLEEYANAGADHIILRVIADDMDQMIDQLNMFAEEVKNKLPAAIVTAS